MIAIKVENSACLLKRYNRPTVGPTRRLANSGKVVGGFVICGPPRHEDPHRWVRSAWERGGQLHVLQIKYQRG